MYQRHNLATFEYLNGGSQRTSCGPYGIPDWQCTRSITSCFRRLSTRAAFPLRNLPPNPASPARGSMTTHKRYKSRRACPPVLAPMLILAGHILAAGVKDHSSRLIDLSEQEHAPLACCARCHVRTPEWARMNDGAGGISCKDNRAREGLHQRWCASGEHYCRTSPGKRCPNPCQKLSTTRYGGTQGAASWNARWAMPIEP